MPGLRPHSALVGLHSSSRVDSSTKVDPGTTLDSIGFYIECRAYPAVADPQSWSSIVSTGLSRNLRHFVTVFDTGRDHNVTLEVATAQGLGEAALDKSCRASLPLSQSSNGISRLPE